MPILHQFDYLFAIGTLAALLDAYNIGANDVANVLLIRLDLGSIA